MRAAFWPRRRRGACLLGGAALIWAVPAPPALQQPPLPLPMEVLVVGAGCTGGLAARGVRDGLRERLGGQAPPPEELRLSVWEWARGPAGRMSTFWSDPGGGGERRVADLGAQVFSTPDAGEASRLRELGAVEAAGLAETCERRAGYSHFWSPGGTSELLRRQLAAAAPDEVAFGRRVTAIRQEGAKWAVEVGARGRGGSRGRSGSPAGRRFDVVILAVTAADALGIGGVRDLLGPDAAGLQQVRYDHRLAVALLLEPGLRARARRLFGGASELDLEGEGGVLGLLAWQDRKRRDHAACTVLVAHSTRAFAARNQQEARSARRRPAELGLEAVLGAVADKLSVPCAQLRGGLLETKVVHWRQCQVQRPFRPTEPSAEPCLTAEPFGGGGPLLVVCGDFFCEGSFHGCSRSASAAARAVAGWVARRLPRAQRPAPEPAAAPRLRRWQGGAAEAGGGDPAPGAQFGRTSASGAAVLGAKPEGRRARWRGASGSVPDPKAGG